jgi:uncharacterized CHY-type Zn-finger protein
MEPANHMFTINEVNFQDPVAPHSFFIKCKPCSSLFNHGCRNHYHFYFKMI